MDNTEEIMAEPEELAQVEGEMEKSVNKEKDKNNSSLPKNQKPDENDFDDSPVFETMKTNDDEMLQSTSDNCELECVSPVSTSSMTDPDRNGSVNSSRGSSPSKPDHQGLRKHPITIKSEPLSPGLENSQSSHQPVFPRQPSILGSVTYPQKPVKSERLSPKSESKHEACDDVESAMETDVDNQEWFCKECDISFSSKSTYEAHKQHYCGLRSTSKRVKTTTEKSKELTLFPTAAMMAPAAAMMAPALLPTPMITPFGMTYAFPYFVPVSPRLLSPPPTQHNPEVERKQTSPPVTKRRKLEDQPLDLSRPKQSPPSPTVIRPAVSRCDDCNIVFYKHENYVVHKQHYCAGRRGKGTSPRQPTTPVTPGSSSSSPIVCDESPKRSTPSSASDRSTPTDCRRESPACTPDEYFVQYFCLPCKIQFSSPDTLEAHQQYYCPARNLLPGPLTPTECPHCDLSFVSIDELTKHLSTHTTMKIPMYCCPYCQYVAQSDSRLLDHIKSHAPTKAFRCTLCGYRGNTVRGMRMHGKSHLDAGENFSDENMVEYEEPPLIPKRLRTVTESISIATESFRISPQDRKRSHSKSEEMMSSRNRQGSHICVECNSTFTNTSKLRLHMQHHLQGKHFQCHACNFTTDVKAELINHVNMSHKSLVMASAIKNEGKNAQKYTIENLIKISPDGIEKDERVLTSERKDSSRSTPERERSPESDGTLRSNRMNESPSPEVQMSPVSKTPDNLYNDTTTVHKAQSPVTVPKDYTDNTKGFADMPGDNGGTVVSPQQACHHINYCSQCDIKFVYLSTFLAHKKYYCSSHAGERRPQPTVTAV